MKFRHAGNSVLPFHGRYLTRLIVLAICCFSAIVALSVSRSGAPATSPPENEPLGVVSTVIAPSPFGELGMDVIVSDGRPKQPDDAPGTNTPETPPGELPRVDVRLLENVLDKTKELYQHPYYHLLTNAALARPDLLEHGARRDLTYTDLWNEPEKYRGQIVFLRGHVRGLVPLEPSSNEFFNPASLSTIYEAHLVTTESQPNAYVIVVPSIPAGMKTGRDVVENVAFAGYFFKLWQYTARDTERAAPLLIGRMLEWTPTPTHQPNSELSMYLAASFVALVLCVGGAMWALNRRTRWATSTAGGEVSPQTTMSELGRLEELDVPNPIDELRKEQDP